MSKRTTLAKVKYLLANQQYDITEERLIQDKVEMVLEENEIPYTREARLTDSDRIDFLIGSLGVEIKLKTPLTQVTRQLHRYAQSDLVTKLLLVTTSPKLQGVPIKFNGKPIHVLLLVTALF